MRKYLQLCVGVALAAVLLVANVQVNAQDPSCNKWCGTGGPTENLGTREDCPDNSCTWIECKKKRSDGCSDKFNDSCDTPESCGSLEE